MHWQFPREKTKRTTLARRSLFVKREGAFDTSRRPRSDCSLDHSGSIYPLAGSAGILRRSLIVVVKIIVVDLRPWGSARTLAIVINGIGGFRHQSGHESGHLSIGHCAGDDMDTYSAAATAITIPV